MRKNRMRRIRRLAVVGVAGGLVAGGVAAIALAAAPTQTLTGSVSPSVLPKTTFAGVTAKFNLDITSSDANPPPPLVTQKTTFDNQVKVEHKGMPVCQPSKLENTDAPAARKACGPAIIGTGFANGKVTFPDQAPIDAPAPVTIFNGPPQGANPVVIIHAYTTVPAPTTFIVPGTLVNAGGGKKSVTFTVPPIAGGYGTLVHFDANLGKKFKVKQGKKTVKKSYANAKCQRGALTVEGSFVYQDGTSNNTTFSAKCVGKDAKKK